MEIVDLKESLLEEACELYSASYRHQRELVPILDESNGNQERIHSMLKKFLEDHPGVAAMENGRLMGYMAGRYYNGLLGVHKGAFVPEWAHASVKENPFEIYRRMYQAIGQRWVEQGCLTHAIQFLSYTDKAQEAFCWNGFGRVCIDAIRPVEAINVEMPQGISSALIQEKDIPAWLTLVDGHNRHLAKSPAFKPYLESEMERELADVIKRPGNGTWIAWKDGEAIGYMSIAPKVDGAAWIVNGERKIAISGAFVKPEFRGKGISKALLSTIMEWAAGEGFVRCSVDFEATNLEACRFWLKHFQPACRSMARRLDERILYCQHDVENRQ